MINTHTIEIIISIILIYGLSMLISAGINILVNTRVPCSFLDFMKLTFLPYVLYCCFFNKDELD